MGIWSFIHHIKKHTCLVKLQAALSLLTCITNQIAKNNYYILSDYRLYIPASLTNYCFAIFKEVTVISMCFSQGVYHSQLILVYWGQGYLEESEAKSAWKPLRIEPEYINLRARKLTFLTFTRLALEFSETRDGCHMAWIITMTRIRLWHSKKKWGKGYLISISKFWKIFHLNWCKEFERIMTR